MDYFILRSDQIGHVLLEKLIKEKKVISHKELIEMNAYSRIEISKGRTHLNDTLLRCTDEHVENELKAQLGHD